MLATLCIAAALGAFSPATRTLPGRARASAVRRPLLSAEPSTGAPPDYAEEDAADEDTIWTLKERGDGWDDVRGSLIEAKKDRAKAVEAIGKYAQSKTEAEAVKRTTAAVTEAAAWAKVATVEAVTNAAPLVAKGALGILETVGDVREAAEARQRRAEEAEAARAERARVAAREAEEQEWADARASFFQNPGKLLGLLLDPALGSTNVALTLSSGLLLAFVLPLLLANQLLGVDVYAVAQSVPKPTLPSIPTISIPELPAMPQLDALPAMPQLVAPADAAGLPSKLSAVLPPADPDAPIATTMPGWPGPATSLNLADSADAAVTARPDKPALLLALGIVGSAIAYKYKDDEVDDLFAETAPAGEDATPAEKPVETPVKAVKKAAPAKKAEASVPKVTTPAKKVVASVPKVAAPAKKVVAAPAMKEKAKDGWPVATNLKKDATPPAKKEKKERSLPKIDLGGAPDKALAGVAALIAVATVAAVAVPGSGATISGAASRAGAVGASAGIGVLGAVRVVCAAVLGLLGAAAARGGAALVYVAGVGGGVLGKGLAGGAGLLDSALALLNPVANPASGALSSAAAACGGAAGAVGGLAGGVIARCTAIVLAATASIASALGPVGASLATLWAEASAQFGQLPLALVRADQRLAGYLPARLAALATALSSIGAQIAGLSESGLALLAPLVVVADAVGRYVAVVDGLAGRYVSLAVSTVGKLGGAAGGVVSLAAERCYAAAGPLTATCYAATTRASLALGDAWSVCDQAITQCVSTGGSLVAKGAGGAGGLVASCADWTYARAGPFASRCAALTTAGALRLGDAWSVCDQAISQCVSTGGSLVAKGAGGAGGLVASCADWTYARAGPFAKTCGVLATRAGLALGAWLGSLDSLIARYTAAAVALAANAVGAATALIGDGLNFGIGLLDPLAVRCNAVLASAAAACGSGTSTAASAAAASAAKAWAQALAAWKELAAAILALLGK